VHGSYQKKVYMNSEVRSYLKKGGTVMKRLLLKRPCSIIIMMLLLFACGTVLGSLQSCKDEAISNVPRISVEKARQKTLSGESLFVCAYDDDASCNEIRLDRGISLAEFESKISDVSKEREIIFFCS
jgi:hypothetical protein